MTNKYQEVFNIISDPKKYKSNYNGKSFIYLFHWQNLLSLIILNGEDVDPWDLLYFASRSIKWRNNFGKQF